MWNYLGNNNASVSHRVRGAPFLQRADTERETPNAHSTREVKDY
jgi:hypothetical protein